MTDEEDARETLRDVGQVCQGKSVERLGAWVPNLCKPRG